MTNNKQQQAAATDLDIELWHIETQNVKPLPQHKREQLKKPTAIKKQNIIIKNIKTQAITPPPPINKPLAKTSPEISKEIPAIIKKITVKNKINNSNVNKNFDKNILRKIYNGTKKIDATLDLHEFTQDEAQAKIKLFLQSAIKTNKRLLLIITGRGKNDAGILKQQVPQWLQNSAFANLVSKYQIAHKKHGGPGALYVVPKKNQQQKNI